MMRRSPKVTMDTISDELGLSKRHVERLVRVLRESGRIAREGGTRGHWIVGE